MPALVSEIHEGERAMHELLKIPMRQGSASFPGLPSRYHWRLLENKLVALGTLDNDGRPWTTVWGGESEFARPVTDNVLAFNSGVDIHNDPVFKALWDGAEPVNGKVVGPGGQEGRPMAGISIDLETRDRVKLMGRFVAGAVVEGGSNVQVAMDVEESLGNCPKYINKKDLVLNEMKPELVSDTFPLPPEAIKLVNKADMLFLSSTNGDSMDTNHRGGSPGFIRVMENTSRSLELIYPEFSGNRLYQSLGNLRLNPLIGIAIPDYDTGDVIYLTGSVSILIGDEASSVLARSNLAIKIKVSKAIFVKSGLPFRGEAKERSPYNPPVRHLISEQDAHVASEPQASMHASLVSREAVTPTISRFTFKLSSSSSGGEIPKWQAGQYATFDFSSEVSAGYSHMRDDDPQSLNDDYIRTFTVSSPPGRPGEFQVTAKKHGPVTNFLWKHNVRAGLDVPVLGFGGEEAFRIPLNAKAPRPVFVAAGVGITPVLAQAQAVLDAGVSLRLLWTLREEDLPLVRETFDAIPKLKKVTKLFVTGQPDRKQVEQLGAEAEMRRIGRADVEELKGKKAKFFLCTGPALLSALGSWLEGEDTVWEDFGY